MRLLARSGEGKLALSHIRHMAPGFGYTVEPHAFDGASALRIRDIWGFDPAAFMSAAPAWLAGANVGVVSARSGLRFRRDGTASFASTELDKVILADDAAIIELLAEDEVAGFASASDHIAILTTPVAPAPLFTVDLDSGGTLVPLAHGTVHGSAPDIGGDGLSRIANCLPAGAGARLAARHRSKALLTHDGAPAFGPLRRNGPYVIAGFGPLDIVLAPLLARLIAGGGTALEAEWAAAHHTQLRQPRPSVAEYHPRAVGAGA